MYVLKLNGHLCAVLGLSLTLAGSVSAAPVASSAWNGTWRLDLARSSAAAKDGAPTAYRLRFTPDGKVVWEIPELGEVVHGQANGTPMAIHRTKPTPGLTLAVTAVGPRELTYAVAKGGKPFGGGRMMLVDDASAWVDLTWGPEGPGYGAELVYALDKAAPKGL